MRKSFPKLNRAVIGRTSEISPFVIPTVVERSTDELAN
jgi:hypothetical protein